MGATPSENDPDVVQELTFRPGNQTGWPLPLEGLEYCKAFGHELQHVLGMSNGLLIGYCVRCPDRVEIPWIRGGTAVALGRFMADEAFTLDTPELSVLEDLGQVAGLLQDDLYDIIAALDEVGRAADYIESRLRDG